jgi:phage terminase small subunit
MPRQTSTLSSTARARASTRTEMTARERLFVAELLKDVGAPGAAAARAGYSERTASKIAHELMQRPVVKAAVEKGMQALAKTAGVDAAKVMQALERLADKAENAGEFTPALRSWELMGKHIGMFRDKVEVTGPGGGPVQFERIVREVVDPK